MFYEKQMKYMDSYCRGVRTGNAGFVKLEVRGAFCSITVQVLGLNRKDSLRAKLFLMDHEWREIVIEGGRGCLCADDLCADDLDHTGISYQQLTEIRIPLSSERELVCRIREAEREEEPEVPVEENTADIPERGEEPEVLVEENTADIPEREEEPEVLTEEDAVDNPERADAAEPEILAEQHPKSEPRTMQSGAAGRIPMREGKWEQLWEIYPHKRPFDDDREYLLVGINDFVVLNENYYRLVSNSFLLHGYYNYRHLLLQRMERGGKCLYYIGVPGIYFEREKQVAVMFGFKSFECATEPADQGDFGYYMIPVEL